MFENFVFNHLAINSYLPSIRSRLDGWLVWPKLTFACGSHSRGAWLQLRVLTAVLCANCSTVILLTLVVLRPKDNSRQDLAFLRQDLAKRINSPELIAPCKPMHTPSRASLTEIPLVKNTGMAAITNSRRTFPLPDGSLYESSNRQEEWRNH